MQALPEKPPSIEEMPLQLLLFVDKRPSSKERIRQIHESLNGLRAKYPFALQTIDVGEQPYMAEHFRLVATPALIKIHPEPRQTLAGSNIVAQIQHWWPQWQRSVDEYLDNTDQSKPRLPSSEVSAMDRLVLAEEASAAAEAAESRVVAPLVSSPKLQRSIAPSAELMQLSDEVFRLQREKEELEHQLKFKDQIISMLAHDLRNPLTAASIALETLEMGHSIETGWSSRLTPSLTAQLLKHARTQTRAINRMITDILQAARGANAGMGIRPQRLDLRQLCLEVLESLSEQFEAKSQRVETDVPSDLPMVLADEQQVRQVLMNLLDNAIKYTPIGGKIQVSALHRTAQKVQVSICDNGLGIPEENRDRIFEDRYRLQRDESKDGYGIGLSLCQRIVRAHYGQIWVDSTPNEGSCFHFTLPVFQL
jgi:two-component system, OmpR family, clock-associated histidine kinase SasA